MTTILVVDDDAPMRDFVGRNLEARQFGVLYASNGLEALARVKREQPDVVILDIMLPHLDGYETCRRLRAFSEVPVIVLTAMGGERDIVQALDCGADDCLTKPFGVEELMARVRSVLRRSKGEVGEVGQVVTIRELRVDLDARRVWLGERELSLTQTEFSVLRFYALNLNKVVPHELVLNSVWGDGYDSDAHYVRIYISRLRAKIESDDETPYFTTEHGLGYRLGE